LLLRTADVLLEGFRPGVMERLGLGPADVHALRPELVYGRVTGWGREGPLAHKAGHDLNYIAVAGALDAIGTAESGPVMPLNLVADYAGGGMLLAYGVVCALFERERSGSGQIVDAAMLDGSALLMGNVFAKWQSGGWIDERASNSIDHGRYYYNVYETSDGKHVSVAAIEPAFRQALCTVLGIDCALLPDDADSAAQREWISRLQAIFRLRTRAEWVELFADSDACFAPVLELAEVLDDPQVSARQVFTRTDSIAQPSPAPRFDRSGTRPITPAPGPGDDTIELLRRAGMPTDELDALLFSGAAAQSSPGQQRV